jgi:hypothetical protein
MRRAVESPGKTYFGDRPMCLPGIPQASRAVTEPTHPDVVRNRAGRFAFECAVNAPQGHTAGLRDGFYGQFRLDQMLLDAALDPGGQHIPVHSSGRRCLELLAHGVPGHFSKRALQGLSAGMTEPVHLVKGLGQCGLRRCDIPTLECKRSAAPRSSNLSAQWLSASLHVSRSGSEGRSSVRFKCSLRSSSDRVANG